jgi:hypothetical protein
VDNPLHTDWLVKKEQYMDMVGQKVIKKSKKPFKSMYQVATVKAVVKHAVKDAPAYLFEEDDSYVECYMCEVYVPRPKLKI